MGDARNQARLRSLPEIGHEASPRQRGEHLVASGEHDISDGETWPTGSLYPRLNDAVAELAKQSQEQFLLMRLRRVVGAPLLRIGLFRRDRGDRYQNGRLRPNVL